MIFVATDYVTFLRLSRHTEDPFWFSVSAEDEWCLSCLGGRLS